ncbi:unnamed protein product [Coffea canephora]|uniref:Uncharacterized protein n=1 Tax=Coffea canephora TaxID=49390 RepID=A0A068V2Z7_COFCA|nr:unnamed protein product [Coffea canephora]
MSSSVALVAFFSIALLACFTEARKDPRGILRPAAGPGAFTEQNEHLGSNTLNEFESKPGSILHADEPRSILPYHGRDANSKEEKPQMKDFESKPESVLFIWGGDKANLQEAKPHMKDFESKPESILFIWGGDKANLQEAKPHMKDFE